MLEILSDGFRNARLKFQGKTVLSEDNVNEAAIEIRKSLLEADVEFGVAKSFVSKVKEKAIGEIVRTKVNRKGKLYKASPAEHFIKICQDELESLMGPVDVSINYKTGDNAISTIMMVGLQGAGKTTVSVKLAKKLAELEKKRKPLLVAADVYRPAAIQQLEVLGERVNIPVYTEKNDDPVQICKNAIDYAKTKSLDTVIFDTAGRLAIDEAMIDELLRIKDQTSPDNIYLVCDAMIGQDAVTTAKAFDNHLSMSGFILTKLDGDARGGAALSIKEVTGKSIKFLGMGENLDALEEFRPEGLASRILGKGDIVGLMNDFEKVVEKEQAEEDAARMLKGQFTFQDFYEQISVIKKLGPLSGVIAKMPFGDMIPSGTKVDDNELVKIQAMINSMTKKERMDPSLLNKNRVGRVAQGSGRSVAEVNDLIAKFFQMRKMMTSMGKMTGMMGNGPGMKNLKKLRKMGGMNPEEAMGSEEYMQSFMEAKEAKRKSQQKSIDRDKLKRKRKAAKKARKKKR